MAVPYTISRQNDPNNPGNYRYRARAVAKGETGMDEIVHLLEQSSTLSGADIHAVVHGVARVISDALADGQIVRLGSVGTFRLMLRGPSHAQETDVKPSAMEPRVHFSPGMPMKQMLRTVELKKT